MSRSMSRSIRRFPSCRSIARNRSSRSNPLPELEPPLEPPVSEVPPEEPLPELPLALSEASSPWKTGLAEAPPHPMVMPSAAVRRVASEPSVRRCA